MRDLVVISTICVLTTCAISAQVMNPPRQLINAPTCYTTDGGPPGG